MRDPTGLDILNMNSPNQSAWMWGEDGIRRIVTHTPEGPWESVVSTLMNSSAKVSYHRLLQPDGKRAIQFVKWQKKAWHAGDLNSRTESVSACCYANKLTPAVEAALAKTTAWRLIQRGLPCIYNPSRDPLAYGFCRHGDLQDNRSDPMTKARFVRVIVPKVRFWYKHYQGLDKKPSRDDKLRAKTGFFAWVAWFLGEGDWKGSGRRDPVVRPNVPKRIPTRWWARLAGLLAGRDK